MIGGNLHLRDAPGKVRIRVRLVGISDRQEAHLLNPASPSQPDFPVPHVVARSVAVRIRWFRNSPGESDMHFAPNPGAFGPAPQSNLL